MFGKKSISDIRRFDAENLLFGILAVAVAAFLVMSFANRAIAGENPAALKGDIVSVDGYAKTLTVRSNGAIPSPSMGMPGEITFATDDMTNVIRCNENKNFEDIRVGETATVTYHEEGGRFIADTVEIPTVILACYEQ